MRRRSRSISEEATENAFAKACADEMTIMMRALAVRQAPVESKLKPVKVDLQSVEIKLDGSATFLSWSKQSPRVWFDRFKKAMIGMGYQQTNADYTIFFQQYGGHITMLVVYVNDMIIIGDDEGGLHN
jgi:hypothetical protein